MIMRHRTLDEFLQKAPMALSDGPLAIIMAEDTAEVESTLRHHLKQGFANLILLGSEGLLLPDDLDRTVHFIPQDVHAEGALVDAVNRVIEAAPGLWIYYGYNTEYLFFPFCETRSVREMITFHTEERREAMLAYVVDLYAGNLDLHRNAVSLNEAFLDKSGYYALPREDAADGWSEKERQLDFYGGLRWRFEEHVPWSRRKIDRIALFKAKAGLRLNPDFTFTDEEMNTYACPWHNNLTAAVCSFRTAKALRSNPGSRQAVPSFLWHNSTPFQWHSQQLMDLGLMEPGQWF
jgi:hypothetical protein